MSTALATLATLAPIVYGTIQTLKRPGIADNLGESLRWKTWPVWAQLVSVFVVSVVFSVLGAYVQHKDVAAALPEALGMGIAAAFAAMGVHTTAKAAGSALTAENREPSSLRTHLDVLLPVDWNKAVGGPKGIDAPTPLDSPTSFGQ